MKLTAIFRGCAQTGIDSWTNYAITRNIPLTEEQKLLLTPSPTMSFGELILEFYETDSPELKEVGE